MSESFKAPADLANMIDPLKEFFTWKWIITAAVTFLSLFTQFVLFCGSIVFGHYYFAVFIILSISVTIFLFLHYAMTPNKLEENLDGIFFNRRIKKGIDTFSKFSPRVNKLVVQNFTGLTKVDEETGLCKEKCNKELY